MRERISRQGGRVGRRGRARLVRPGLEALGRLPWACDLLGCVWPWGEALAWGEALPSGLCCCLGCAPCAWACMCACVYGRVGLPACCLGYARRRCPQPHPPADHTPPGGPAPCRRSAARLLPCPRPRPAARPAADPAGPAPCDMATAAPEGFYAPGLVSRRSKLYAPL